jgi:acyl-[acyl-carrier-protein]-phospholipid O-acyltransferase/long-chain-fatty-acid--[acyl-carrier-protein] ligase
VFGIDLGLASQAVDFASADGVLHDFHGFMAHEGSLRILIDLALIATCAGLYIVPLYAIMQHDSDAQVRARIIAANNVYNALFMVASALITLALLSMQMSITHVFLMTASLNIVAAIYIRALVKKASANSAH